MDKNMSHLKKARPNEGAAQNWQLRFLRTKKGPKWPTGLKKGQSNQQIKGVWWYTVTEIGLLDFSVSFEFACCSFTTLKIYLGLYSCLSHCWQSPHKKGTLSPMGEKNQHARLGPYQSIPFIQKKLGPAIRVPEKKKKKKKKKTISLIWIQYTLRIWAYPNRQNITTRSESWEKKLFKYKTWE